VAVGSFTDVDSRVAPAPPPHNPTRSPATSTHPNLVVIMESDVAQTVAPICLCHRDPN
jgi:hypothetical protein